MMAATDTMTSSSTPTTDPELRTLNKLRQLYLAARNAKRARYDTWIRNYRLVNNRFGGGQSSNWMPSPRDSEIYPGLSSLVAWMTDQDTSVSLTPAVDPASPVYDTISVLSSDLNDILNTNWHVEAFDAQIKLSLWDAFMYGTGILKSVWDNQLAFGFGNATLRRVDPWAFYVDPYATSLDDAEYMIEVRRMSWEEIERRFPETCKKVRSSATSDTIDEKPDLYLDVTRTGKANPGTIPQSGVWPGSSPGVGRWSNPTSDRLFEPLPGHVVYEFWLRENDHYTDNDPESPDYAEHRVQEKWRLVVMCANHILLDADVSDLWSYGGHPYDDFAFDDIGEFYGIALVDHLSYPQIYVNRLLTALQHNAELTGNPVFIEPANSGLQRVGIINKPGQRLTVSGPGAMQNRPDWLTPPAMPAQVLELVQFWISRIENIMGLTALQKGITPTQRNAEGALNMVQEAAFVRIRSALNNLEIALRSAIAKQADLIIDNYTEARIMPILTGDGDMTARLFSDHHFQVPGPNDQIPFQYLVQVNAGANEPTSRSGRSMELDRMYAMQLVDDEYVLQQKQIPNYREILARKYKKAALGFLNSSAHSRARA